MTREEIFERLTRLAVPGNEINVDVWHVMSKAADQVQKDAHLEEQLQAVRDALTEILSALDGEPEYHDQGMGCGLEDRNITDRYDAMAFGWDEAMERIYSEHVNYALDAARTALKSIENGENQ